MRKVIKLFIIFSVFVIVSIGVVALLSFGNLNIEINKDRFRLKQVVHMDTSTYSGNGSSWGHNQNKLASIGDIIFTFDFDNSNLEFGNSSVDNSYSCKYIYIHEYSKNEIDTKPCNRPGNVLTDPVNNKVYYILVEPTGPAHEGGYDFTGVAKTVMYEYDFDPVSKNLTLYEVHDVTPESSDGKIRQGVDIDSSGNIVIAYGTYNGYIVFYTFDYANRLWTNYQYLSNDDNDSLMYVSVSIKDLNNIYFLAEQDTSNETGVYYQYVKFFAYEDNTWKDYMIVDYRDNEIASREPRLVINADIELYQNQVHILAAAQQFSEITYYIYSECELEIVDSSYIKNGTRNLKFFEHDENLYISGMSFKYKILFPTFTIYDSELESTIYSITSVVRNNYFYINKQDESISLLLYSDNKGKLYFIHPIE